MNLAEHILGLSAAVFEAISLLPQLIKMVRKNRPTDISGGMLLVLLIGLILWVVYGIVRHDWPIIIANSCSLIINIIIICVAYYYKKREKKSRNKNGKLLAMT